MRKTIASLAGACCAVSAFAGFQTAEPAYLNSTALGNFSFSPLITVGDYVPLSGGTPADKFALSGIPDAMGLYKDPVTSENILFVAHELTNGSTTEPIYGATRLKGAFVSRFVLDSDASVVSGGLAHNDLYLENTFYSPQPPKATDAAAFTRFCSGAFAGPAHGMDRPIFFTNEESASGTFNSRGALSVAIMDGKMYTLPALGRVARETTLVMPRRDAITAILSFEDEGTPSYIYMYVGTKQRRSTSPLDKNGLTNGKVYVLGAQDLPTSGANTNGFHWEGSFGAGSLPVKWIEIPGAAGLTGSALANQAATVGGFGFVRVEDGDFDPLAPTRTLFVCSTGGSSPNRLGRLYKINFNPTNPVANGTMDIVYNADTIVTPGGDINAGTDFAVSADAICVTANYIVICEDRNSPADQVWNKYGRNGGVWTLDRNNNYAAKCQADFNFAYANARDGGTPRTVGLWEASGVIDASSIYGPDTFLINVQAHGASPSKDRSNILKPDGSGTYTQAQANTLFNEDGQVLLMKPKVN
jgi:hypothetical protein